MLQQEIDEISEAFLDAWEEYFGQVMYYIPFDSENTVKHPIYKDTVEKKYKEDEKAMFHGTLKQEPIEEKGELGGKLDYEVAEITFVFKELYDLGITSIDPRSIIEVTDREGITKRYNIIENYGKVQFGSSKIFYKLKVTDRDMKK